LALLLSWRAIRDEEKKREDHDVEKSFGILADGKR